MPNPPNNLQPAIQRVYADHKRIVKEKNRAINALQAEKGELQRTLQAKSGEVLRAKMQSKRDLDESINAHQRADAAERAMHDEQKKARRYWSENKELRSLHEGQIELIGRLQNAAQPRPLSPDAIEVALHDWMPTTAIDRLSGTQMMQLAEDIHAALTEPLIRPEGAEEIERVLLDSGMDVLDDGRAAYANLADYLASRTAEWKFSGPES